MNRFDAPPVESGSQGLATAARKTSFAAYVAILLAMMAALWRAPETLSTTVGSVRDLSLRPRMGIPRGIRLPFLGAAAMAFAAFGLGGFYAALTPGLLSSELHYDSAAVIGGGVALFFGSAACTAFVTRALRSRASVYAALGLLLAGVPLLLIAEARESLALILVATIINGAATALGYRGSLQATNEMAPADRHAEVISSYLLVCYVGNALLVLGVGLLAQAIGATNAHRVLGGLVAALAVLAAGVVLRYGRRARPSPTRRAYRNARRSRQSASRAT